MHRGRTAGMVHVAAGRRTRSHKVRVRLSKYRGSPGTTALTLGMAGSGVPAMGVATAFEASLGSPVTACTLGPPGVEGPGPPSTSVVAGTPGTRGACCMGFMTINLLMLEVGVPVAPAVGPVACESPMTPPAPGSIFDFVCLGTCFLALGVCLLATQKQLQPQSPNAPSPTPRQGATQGG
jgi:hypothetical protein